MSMQRHLYPKNWESIARAVKEAASWTCQECDRPCRLPGESDRELIDRIEDEHRQWQDDLWMTVVDDELGEAIALKLGRFTLTTAHLDHNPPNCSPDNLKALCSVCHCRMDLKAMALKRQLKREREGQLNLFTPPRCRRPDQSSVIDRWSVTNG